MVEAMSVNRGFFTSFGQQLRQGSSAWQAFKSSGLDALGKIADKLASMAADKLFASAFGGSTGGLGSLFGLGGGSAGSGSVPSWSGADLGAGTGGLSIPMFASGTSSAPGGLSVVGEKGPELVNLPRGAKVFSNMQTQGMLAGAGAVSVKGGDTQIVIQGNADDKTIAIMQRELAKRDAEFNSKVVQTVKLAKTQRHL
jgi:hypothetical protein